MNEASSDNLKSLVEYFYHWEQTTPDKPFLRQPHGDEWTVVSYSQAGDQARRMATYLKSCGLEPGDHVGIYSKNCMHWFIADLAILIGGYVSVPFYASLPADQLKQVLDISDVKALFVGRTDSWGDRADAVDSSIDVIRFPEYQGDPSVSIGKKWETIIAEHEPLRENFVPALDDVWTIKFTSGTTGSPKGVVHTHRSPGLIMENERISNWIGLCQIENDLSYFSFLPLNHVGERVGVLVPAIAMGGKVSFSENLTTFAKNFADTQPDVLFAVPRIWTLFYLGVIEKMPMSFLKFTLNVPVLSTIFRNKIRKKLGLLNLKVAVTGAAITPPHIKEFYTLLGIHLIEAYGMTEVCGSMTNSPDPDSPNTSVGKAIPFGDVKIDEKTGEILMRSPYMMQGYYKNPEKTAEVLKDGWLHSGDRGKIGDDGYVYVTGRISDAFKTAKGSYVTPNPLEEVISTNSYVEQVCVAGLGIPQPIALLNLSELGKKEEKETVEKSLLATINELNQSRAKFERISTAIIFNEPWSQENGILTPTLKVKRGTLDDNYAAQYLEWHESKDPVVWL